MKIGLVKPPILHKGASFALMPTPPLGLAYIAAVLKQQGHHIQVVDASAEDPTGIYPFKDDIFVFGLPKDKVVRLIDNDTPIICFALMFTNNWLYDREVIKEVKKAFPKAILIAGGEHATAVPDLVLNQSPIDYVVLGEGEHTIKDLVHHIETKQAVEKVSGIAYKKNGKLVKTKGRIRESKPENIPWPAWEAFPLSKYFAHKMTHGVYRGNTLPVMATRGCPYKCTFCSNPKMWGKAYEMRPVNEFVDELEYLHRTYNVVNFDFYDLTAIMVKDWIVEMCKEIINRGLDIAYQLPSGTRAEAIDYEVADLLNQSGCKNITYAPESGSDKVLRKVKKEISVNAMLLSIKQSNQAGLIVHLNMILGFPDDTHKDLWKTIWFLLRCSWNGAHDIAPAVFTPYPGSTLYNRLAKKGILDIYDDQTIIDIINSYDLWPSKVYTEKISGAWLKVYIFLFTFFFYGSNYLFRPHRLFKTIWNLITQKHESRLEQILYKNFIKNALSIFRLQKVKT